MAGRERAALVARAHAEAMDFVAKARAGMHAGGRVRVRACVRACVWWG